MWILEKRVLERSLAGKVVLQAVRAFLHLLLSMHSRVKGYRSMMRGEMESLVLQVHGGEKGLLGGRRRCAGAVDAMTIECMTVR
jgi:hypothetical protein